MKVLGVTTVNALRQSNQRLSHRRVKRVEWEVRRGLDSAFLVERELLRSKRFSGREDLLARKVRIKKRSKSANKFSQSRQDFNHGPMPVGFNLLPSNWSQFSTFHNFCGGHGPTIR
jgi:hypothetical protein